MKVNSTGKPATDSTKKSVLKKSKTQTVNKTAATPIKEQNAGSKVVSSKPEFAKKDAKVNTSIKTNASKNAQTTKAPAPVQQAKVAT